MSIDRHPRSVQSREIDRLRLEHARREAEAMHQPPIRSWREHAGAGGTWARERARFRDLVRELNAIADATDDPVRHARVLARLDADLGDRIREELISLASTGEALRRVKP
jgi:hypothetical protein